METKKINFVAALRSFFGYKPGEGLREFGEELKSLSPADRRELAEMLGKELKAEVLITPAGGHG